MSEQRLKEPALAVLDRAGAVVDCFICPGDPLATLPDCIENAIKRVASQHAGGSDLWVPCREIEATRTVFRIDAVPTIFDPAIESLLVQTTGIHVLFMRKAGVTVLPETAEQSQFMAALRAHWLSSWNQPLLNVPLDLEQIPCPPEKFVRFFKDYGLAVFPNERPSTAQHRLRLCDAEGLDVTSVEKGGRELAVSILRAIEEKNRKGM